MGPLISADQRETVASYVPDDAPVAIRGSAPDGPGYWFPPTVLAPVSNDDRAAREEIFGPVACVIPFEDEARGGADRQRHDLRPLGLGLDPRRRQGAAGGAGASRPACSRSTRTARCGSRPRSAASSSRASAASSARDALEHYTEVKNVFYATEGG